MRERILAHAEKLFYQFGVKAARLDDIARALGISRKTLYQYVSTKEDLIRRILKGQLERALRVAGSELANADNPVKHALQIWDRLILYRTSVNPNFRRDIKRYYPGTWDLSQVLEQQYVSRVLIASLQQGIDEGVYRTDLDVPVLAWLWQVQSHLDVPSAGADTTLKHHFIRGLLTPKGFTLYEHVAGS